MGYYNLPPTKYAAELSELERLLRALPLDGAIPALDLVETFSRNVIQHPAEEKYRRIRTTNPKLSPLFGLAGAREVMLEIGWQVDPADSEFMFLPKGTKLDFQQHVVKVLEAKSHFGKEQEAAKKIAKPVTQDKGDVLRQLEIDRRERAAARPELPIAVNRPAAKSIEASAPPAATPASAPVAPAQVPAAAPAPAPAAAKPKTKTAFDFEKRVDPEEKKKEEELSLADLRALQKAKFKEFQADPHAMDSEAYKRPPSSGNGSAEAGWFDWMWGGSSGSGSSDNKPRGPPPGPRIKTVGDLPKPVQRGG